MSLTCQDKDKNDWRWYTDSDGANYISVTSVLAHIIPIELKRWFIRTPAEEIDDKSLTAADHGTTIARALEDKFKHGLDNKLPELDALSTLLAANNLKIVDVEFPVHSSQYGFAGRVDMLLEHTAFDGRIRRILGDLKTGRMLSPTTGWQLAAYRQAYNELHPLEPVEGYCAIHLPRHQPEKGKVFHYEHLDFCFHAFLSCLQTFKGLYWTRLSKLGWPWLEKNIFETE